MRVRARRRDGSPPDPTASSSLPPLLSSVTLLPTVRGERGLPICCGAGRHGLGPRSTEARRAHRTEAPSTASFPCSSAASGSGGCARGEAEDKAPEPPMAAFSTAAALASPAPCRPSALAARLPAARWVPLRCSPPALGLGRAVLRVRPSWHSFTL